MLAPSATIEVGLVDASLLDDVLDLLIIFRYTIVVKRGSTSPKWRNWQTRTTQTRVPSGVWVRFPPSAPFSDDFGLYHGPFREQEGLKY